MDPSCPYRQIMGAEFDALPAVVRRAHSAPLVACGSADVWRGSGFGGLPAALFGLPRAGLGRRLELQLTQRADEIGWWRAFDGRTLNTKQRAIGNMIHEHAGPVRIAFSVRSAGGGVRHESHGVWLLGLPLPAWARPRAVAQVTAAGRWWNVTVRIDHPFVGLLCEYRGRLEPG